jgi:hypothetical protein
LGLLLALNRWAYRLDYDLEIEKFSQGIVHHARQKTTTISYNLLECASEGQADERLVKALDGLFTGQFCPDECAAQLLTWGSSSGCDALVGMALAILVLSTSPERSRDVC